MSLKEKVVVVTGATGALGRVVAKTFLNEGAHVVSMYKSEEKMKELEDFLGETGGMLSSVQADAVDEGSVQSLFQKVVQQQGRVDVLLNIVGGYKGGADIANTTVSDWDFMMDLNLKSVFLCSKAALPLMMRQNYGKIVNVASRTAVEKRYRSRSGAYAVSKAGVIALARAILKILYDFYKEVKKKKGKMIIRMNQKEFDLEDYNIEELNMKLELEGQPTKIKDE